MSPLPHRGFHWVALSDGTLSTVSHQVETRTQAGIRRRCTYDEVCEMIPSTSGQEIHMMYGGPAHRSTQYYLNKLTELKGYRCFPAIGRSYHHHPYSTGAHVGLMSQPTGVTRPNPLPGIMILPGCYGSIYSTTCNDGTPYAILMATGFQGCVHEHVQDVPLSHPLHADLLAYSSVETEPRAACGSGQRLVVNRPTFIITNIHVSDRTQIYIRVLRLSAFFKGEPNRLPCRMSVALKLCANRAPTSGACTPAGCHALAPAAAPSQQMVDSSFRRGWKVVELDADAEVEYGSWCVLYGAAGDADADLELDVSIDFPVLTTGGRSRLGHFHGLLPQAHHGIRSRKRRGCLHARPLRLRILALMLRRRLSATRKCMGVLNEPVTWWDADAAGE
ncbi:hypothetical protein JB92DRAFT_2836573 [Gautieria morchelliformis]|nr:hypothetical protein JB92DRAFT_2836573 [Gautieria morchelliformis]